MTGKIRVAVLFGGRSGEHEVSLVSAQSVMSSLDPERYEIIPVGITREGQWLVSGDPMAILKKGDTSSCMERAFLPPDPNFKAIVVMKGDEKGAFRCERLIPIDVVFPVLHGPYGEDGKFQGLFEIADIPYVGAGVLASSCGMDKIAMKELFRAAGLPVTPGISFSRKQWYEEKQLLIGCIERDYGYPLFIKPANLGSSVGISKAHDRNELIKGVDDACSYDRKVLVEKAVAEAREIECSVLGNENAEASVLGEIFPCNEFYDYEAKYVAGKTRTVAPAELTEEHSETIRKMAVKAYKALDCEGMARVDFLLEKQTGNVIANELNTIPGFTSISMYPQLWEATGLKYKELLDRLIMLALDRQEEKEKTRTGIELENDWYRK
jgi:D-alanine-D-alanine ligase